jgi:hypothetical protein
MNQTALETKQKKEKLRDLEAKLKANKVTVKVNARTKKVQFVGWEVDRTGPSHWHDDCAYRTLMSEGSSALRMAMARMAPAERQLLATR